jgi:hypothetical protein
MVNTILLSNSLELFLRLLILLFFGIKQHPSTFNKVISCSVPSLSPLTMLLYLARSLSGKLAEFWAVANSPSLKVEPGQNLHIVEYQSQVTGG